MVGLIRRRLDLHRSERDDMDCLGCDLRHSIKTAAVIRESYVMP